MTDLIRNFPRTGAAILFGLAAACGTLHAQESLPPDPESLWSKLTEGAGSNRDGCADELVALARRPEVARQLGARLVSDATPPEARVRLMDAIARCWDPPGRLYAPIVALAKGKDPAVAAAAMPALAAFRSREALQSVADFATGASAEPVRNAAIAALVQVSGRDDLGPDAASCQRWLADHQHLSPAEWQDLLAEGVWRRSIRLAAQRSAMTEQLIDGFRRLYLTLPAPPADDRPRLISQLLLGAQSELRNLAFDLVNRELSAGNPVDGMVTEAAAKLMESPDPAVRIRAASLLVQLAPSDAGARMASALSRETDPGTAEELLRGVIRWPVPAARAPVLQWLGHHERPARAALDAALALINAGILTATEDQHRVLVAARSACADTPTTVACRLRVVLGDSADRDAVIGLLASPTPSVRLAAVQSLVDQPEAVGAIVAAAASDPALYSYCVEATASSRATVDGFEALEAIPAPSPEAKSEGLRRVASALSASDLLRIADRPGMDPTLVDAMLSRLIEHGPRPGLRMDDPHAIFEGIMLLVRTRLALKRPDLALVALNALPPSPPGVDPAKSLRLRIIALLWTNHIAEAVALNAPAEDWLDGFEAAIGEPHARAVFREIKTRFGPTLTLEETRRFDHLAMRIITNPSIDDPTPPNTSGAPGGR